MNSLRKSLLILFCLTLFSMEISRGMDVPDEKINQFIQKQGWIDKRKIIVAYYEIVKRSNTSEDYVNEGKKKATFFPDGSIQLFSENGDTQTSFTMPVGTFLKYIEKINDDIDKKKGTFKSYYDCIN